MDDRTFEIWSEGYVARGKVDEAIFMGTAEAPSFKDACVKMFKDDPHFDPEKMTYWSCRLFDNETQARRSFG